MVYIKKLPEFFIMNQTMIIILLQKSQQKIMRDNLLVQEKIQKNSVPIEKEVKRIGKNGEEITKMTSYKLKIY